MSLPAIHSSKDLVRLFFTYRRPAVYAGVGVLLGVILLLALFPPRYTSDARLLVKPGRENVALPVELMGRAVVTAPGGVRDYLLDEEAFLTSEALVAPLARELADRLTAASPPEGVWEHIKAVLKGTVRWTVEQARAVLEALRLLDPVPLEESVEQRLRKYFEVSHEAGSSVLELRFTWKDPAVAQMVLDAWVRHYLERRAQLMDTPEVHAFYRQRLADSEARLRELEARLGELRQRIGALDVDQAARELNERITTLEGARDELRARLAGIEAQLAEAKTRLAETPKEVVTRRETGLNPSVEDIRRRLLEARLERERLLRTFRPDAEPVKLLERSIREMEAWLEKEPERIARKETLAPNKLAEALSLSVQELTLSQARLRAELAQKEAQIHELAQRRDRLLAMEAERAEVSRRLATEKESYRAYAAALQQARLDEALDRERISNVVVMQAASYNPARSFPKTLPVLAATPFLALAAMLLTVWLAALLDRKARSGELVQRQADVPLLADIPLPQPGVEPEVIGKAYYDLWSALELYDPPPEGKVVGLVSWLPGDDVAQIVEGLARLCEASRVPVRKTRNPEALPAPGEVVLVELPPLKGLPADRLVDWHHLDEVVLVVQAERTPLPVVRHALHVLRRACGNAVKGVVLNGRRLVIPPRLYRWLSS